MRDYKYIDGYLNEMTEQVYPQPQDELHTRWAQEAINTFARLAPDANSVLDLGCGEGFCEDMFKAHDMEYVGVCIGEDAKVARAAGKNVFEYDFSFLPFEDSSYDMLFARHALEHSPMPLLTLMEWKRVARRYIALVLPSPSFWGYRGHNHYFVLNDDQWRSIFESLGLFVLHGEKVMFHMSPDPEVPNDDEIEYRYLLVTK